MDWNTDIKQAELTAAVETLEFNLFALLKPRIFRDGNQWCVLYGDDLMDGVSGFGDTPYSAMLAWTKDWNNDISKLSDPHPNQRKAW